MTGIGSTLPNRLADNETGGSGAAAAWPGSIRHDAAEHRATGMLLIPDSEFTTQHVEFT